jgi:hypothetical protein
VRLRSADDFCNRLHAPTRDCAHYAVRTPSGPVHVLVNHFKSRSGGGGTQRQRQGQ